MVHRARYLPPPATAGGYEASFFDQCDGAVDSADGDVVPAANSVDVGNSVPEANSPRSIAVRSSAASFS